MYAKCINPEMAAISVHLKKKKTFRTTDPSNFMHVTGNTHIFCTPKLNLV